MNMNGICKKAGCNNSAVERLCNCEDVHRFDWCLHCVEFMFLKGGDCDGCENLMAPYIKIAETSYRRFDEFDPSFEEEMARGENELDNLRDELIGERTRNQNLSGHVKVLQNNLQILDGQIDCLRTMMSSLAKIHNSVVYSSKRLSVRFTDSCDQEGIQPTELTIVRYQLDEQVTKNLELVGQVKVLENNLQILDGQIDCLKTMMTSMANIHGSVSFTCKQSGALFNQ